MAAWRLNRGQGPGVPQPQGSAKKLRPFDVDLFCECTEAHVHPKLMTKANTSRTQWFREYWYWNSDGLRRGRCTACWTAAVHGSGEAVRVEGGWARGSEWARAWRRGGSARAQPKQSLERRQHLEERHQQEQHEPINGAGCPGDGAAGGSGTLLQVPGNVSEAELRRGAGDSSPSLADGLAEQGQRRLAPPEPCAEPLQEYELFVRKSVPSILALETLLGSAMQFLPL